MIQQSITHFKESSSYWEFYFFKLMGLHGRSFPLHVLAFNTSDRHTHGKLNCNIRLFYITACVMPPVSPLRSAFFSALAVFKTYTKKQKFGTRLGPKSGETSGYICTGRSCNTKRRTSGMKAIEPATLCPHNVHILGSLHRSSASLTPRTGCL